MFLYTLLVIIFFLPISIFMPAIIKGKKNFRKLKKQGFILIANHQSMLDIPLVGINFLRHQHFVAKAELGKSKFMRWVIKKTGCFFVERGKPNLAFFKEAQKLLKNNKILTMFPEGTRKKVSSEEMGELKNGVAMLAIKTGVKILPLYVANKPGFFKFNKIIVGEAFDLNEFDKVNHENLKLATEKIAGEFKKLHEKVNKKSKK